nr:hypothetical protein Iba_chr04eCG14910 [Ipomoea batatas]
MMKRTRDLHILQHHTLQHYPHSLLLPLRALFSRARLDPTPLASQIFEACTTAAVVLFVLWHSCIQDRYHRALHRPPPRPHSCRPQTEDPIPTLDCIVPSRPPLLVHHFPSLHFHSFLCPVVGRDWERPPEKRTPAFADQKIRIFRGRI